MRYAGAHRRSRSLVFFAAVAVALVMSAPAMAGRRTVKQDLAPTSADPNANGHAQLVLHGDSNGKLDILVRHLDAHATFGVVVGGVNIGSLTTNGHGKGKARFRSKPGAHDALLGVDPRGQSVSIRNGDGQDVLHCDLPDDQNPDDVACCVPGHHGGVECERKTPDECAQRGGSVSGAFTCLPDPCGQAAPEDVICCLGSASGALLHEQSGGDGEHHGGGDGGHHGGDDDHHDVPCTDDLTQADCAAQGGTVVQATSCHPNPCQPVTPPVTVAPCCVPDDDGDSMECEVFTPERCMARGGTAASAASCDPDPCGGSGQEHHHGHGEHHGSH